MDTRYRCWQYRAKTCRDEAHNYKRVGDVVLAYCDNPDHEPQAKEVK